MEGGTLIGLMLVLKLGLGASALIAIGLSLHIASGVVRRAQAIGLHRLATIAALLALLFGGFRMIVTSAELSGDLVLAFDPQSLAWAWSSHQGNLAALGGGALAVLIAPRVQPRALAGVGSVIIAASFAFLGHTQALEAPGLAPWALALHVLIAGFWVVAPLTLWPARSAEDDDLAVRLDRFGALALLLIPALFALGLWLAWRLSGGFEPLLSSLYGQLLMAKLSLALLALGLGALNKKMVAKLVTIDPMRGRHWLRMTLSLDGLLFAGALLLVTLATTISGPPR